MSDLVKIDGHNSLRKDTSTGAVVNVDKSAYESHMLAKRLAKNQLIERQISKQTIENMQDEINTLKTDLSQIKSLLTKLVTDKGL